MHENEAYFRKCDRRRRNYGLFYADQGNPDDPNKSARFTRQGNDQTRYGYECPEERDYYPYWHPSPWKDIAIFTSRTARCEFFQQNSQNTAPKYWCVSDENDLGDAEYYETAAKCEASLKGKWVAVDPWNIPAPECYAAGWNRDNHLGNGPGGYTNSYKWVLPKWTQINSAEIVNPLVPVDSKETKAAPCIFRLRYNVSTGDYRGGVENKGLSYAQGGFADRSMNAPNSPITQDPYFLYGKSPDATAQEEWPLVLALDTSQFSRTFEERSHMFYIKPLPLGHIGNIYNLAVRGKRGNIVQTYPAVEYDFVPRTLQINMNDFIHFQVRGCDTNPQGNDGEGQQQTDRSNMVQLTIPDQNKLDLSTYGAMANKAKAVETTTMWGPAGSKQALSNTWKMAHIQQFGNIQCTSIDQTQCCYTLDQLNSKHGNNNGNKAQDPQNCAVLNGAGGNAFDSGLVRMTEAGTFHYMSSRNNNFSNRSQKGAIVIGSVFSVPTVIAIVAGGGAAASAMVVSAAAWSGSASCLATVRV